jgi:tRNA-dihydrouridine synthase B
MQIGPHQIDPPLVLAPMAGVTDKPFRQLCRRLGAGLAVSEMTSADPRLRDTRKSRLRRDHAGEPAPISVQLAGYDPAMLAEAARWNVAHGAQIIDLNMGCPAKKVCNVAAGSALLRDEALVGRILEAVVTAVSVPVTLKIRTGYSRTERNALQIARIAENAGIAALAIHGRTREDHFRGDAEYTTVAAVKAAVGIPVIANGDVRDPVKARDVLRITGADGLMIGRAAQGRPWIFREIAHFLATGARLPAPSATEVSALLLEHLEGLYVHHGEYQGVRIARKHIGWYCADHPDGRALRETVNHSDSATRQRELVEQWFAARAADRNPPPRPAPRIAAAW